MKKYIILIVVLFNMSITSFAQFDNRFYLPSKDYQLDDKLIYEDLFFETDTVKLHVLYLKPDISAKATVFFYIGGGGNASSYTYIAKPLIATGYQVLIPEPRGYGKSTGVPTHIDIARDAQFIFDSIVKRNGVKSIPILIYGASMGSQIAVKIAKDNQDKVNGLILDCPISSFTDIALANSPEEQRQIISQYVTSPYSAKEDIMDINNMPKLIIYSKEDKSVPPEQGALVFSNSKRPKSLWVYNGEHLMSSVQYQGRFIQKIDSIWSAGQNSQNNSTYYKIDILIKGFKNNNGQVVVELKDTLEQTIISVTQKIINNQSHVVFDQIESGSYTITYYHDENNNNEFDTNFIGMPKEGYGFSNNASGKYGPPPIDDRIFAVSKNLSLILKPYYK